MKIEVDFQPIGKRVEVTPGTTVLEAAQEAGVGISAICGGNGSCGACRVRLTDQKSVGKPTETEIEILDADELSAGLRLACRTEIYGTTRVDVPPESMSVAQRTQVEGKEIDFTFAPPVAIEDLALPKATITDLTSDFDRISSVLSNNGHPPLHCRRLDIIKRIPELLRQNDWRIRVGVRGDELVSVAAPGTPLLGLAVDIGTTKVAGYLVDMATGQTLAMEGIMNPQIAYGEDVMSRISYCMNRADGLDILQKAMIDALNELSVRLCRTASENGEASRTAYAPSQIIEAVMVGNTAMHHILLGLPVKQLGLAPYIAAVSSPLDVKADEIGLNFSFGATVHLPCNIAGFVGADHVSMLLATNTHTQNGVVVSLDIGTNTEITIGTRGRLIACSTASGPAFEGAHIRHGMRAADGAIEHVQIEAHELTFQTIGNAPPVGICGSGILDAIAQLKRCGAIDHKGAFEEKHPLIRRRNEELEVLLAPADQTPHIHDIVLTRSDVNEIQLAKGAMRAGIEILLDAAGVSAADIDEFIIAGAFGTYISVASAVEIGMFPNIPLSRFHQVGNAAGIGARQVLLSSSRRAEAADIGKRVEYLELTTSKIFQKKFLEAMYL